MTKHNQSAFENALAILIANTRRTRRSIPLTEVSRWLEVAKRSLGSYPLVAERVGLSPHMLRQFTVVERLVPSVRNLFRTRRIDSVDAAVHLAMLPRVEQEIAARALIDREIDTKDLRAATRLRRVGAPGSLLELMKRVKASKTKREYIAEFVVRGSHTKTSILAAITRHIPAESIARLELTGRLGRLVLNTNGRAALKKTATQLGVSLDRVIPLLLSSRED